MKSETAKKKFKKRKHFNIYASVAVFLVLVFVFTSGAYFIMNTFATRIVTSYLTELVEHDKDNIRSYVSERYSLMKMVYNDLKVRNPDDLLELQSELKIQAELHDVEMFYLMDEDDSLYSSDYQVLSKYENPFISYFKDDKENKVGRYETIIDGENTQYIIYTYNFTTNLKFEEQGKEFVGLVMLRDVRFLTEKMRIHSFNGRGYTSVVDENGVFVVEDDLLEGDQIRSIFEFLEGRKIKDTTIDEITEKFYKRESFSFWYVDRNGVEKFILSSPSETSDWTFLTSIEKSVYSDQIRLFIELIIFIMGALFTTFLVTFGLYGFSRRKLQAFYSAVVHGVRSRQYYDDKVLDANVTSLAVVDIDHLKWINDKYGHLAGDKVIREMALCLIKYAGPYGEVCRFGGDEFVIAFQKELSKETFELILNRIEEEIRLIQFEDYPELHMTLSIGGYYGKGTTEELFVHADAQLYEAKKTRNCVFIGYNEEKKD